MFRVASSSSPLTPPFTGCFVEDVERFVSVVRRHVDLLRVASSLCPSSG
ncbi:putative leader peptide [Cryptosporangium aurantiacum]